MKEKMSPPPLKKKMRKLQKQILTEMTISYLPDKEFRSQSIKNNCNYNNLLMDPQREEM